jgi:hypothetical protein
MATDRPTTPRTKRTTSTTTGKASSTRRATSASSTRATPASSAQQDTAQATPSDAPGATPNQRRAPINEMAKPLLASVGAADLAVEKLLTLPVTAGSEVRRLSDRVGVLTVEAVKVPTQVSTTVRALPEAVGAQLSGLQGRAAQLYNAWADRGEKRVTEIRRNPATEDAVTRTKSAVSRTRAARTSARRAADAVGKAATSQAFGRRPR